VARREWKEGGLEGVLEGVGKGWSWWCCFIVMCSPHARLAPFNGRENNALAAGNLGPLLAPNRYYHTWKRGGGRMAKDISVTKSQTQWLPPPWRAWIGRGEGVARSSVAASCLEPLNACWCRNNQWTQTQSLNQRSALYIRLRMLSDNQASKNNYRFLLIIENVD